MVGFSQLKISHSFIEQMFIEDILCNRKLWYEWHMEILGLVYSEKRQDHKQRRKERRGERGGLHLLSKIKHWDPIWELKDVTQRSEWQQSIALYSIDACILLTGRDFIFEHSLYIWWNWEITRYLWSHAEYSLHRDFSVYLLNSNYLTNINWANLLHSQSTVTAVL